ncbi:hypothetical protein HY479_02805 [Candidatus Uhrbacteria bacterium]|nr:hypothetical protein [Candidatus Uhrbacteria bacterium]
MDRKLFHVHYHFQASVLFQPTVTVYDVNEEGELSAEGAKKNCLAGEVLPVQLKGAEVIGVDGRHLAGEQKTVGVVGNLKEVDGGFELWTLDDSISTVVASALGAGIRFGREQGKKEMRDQLFRAAQRELGHILQNLLEK